MRTIQALAVLIAAMLLSPTAALAQSVCPSIAYGAVLTAAQWNGCFTGKQDVLNFSPVNKAGDTMLGKFVTTPATTLQAGLNISPGGVPLTPKDGDMWTTGSGFYIRIGGNTIGPITSGFPLTAPTNYILAGPAIGAPAYPTFRLLTASDLPAATSSAIGAVKPDNATVTISSGTITAKAVVGTTAVVGGTNTQCFYNNAGTLGSKNCLTQVKIQSFLTAGSFTYTPTAGLNYAQVECVGGGAGGGGATNSTNNTSGAGGGGSGAYSRVALTAAQIGASKTGTIGAKGAAGSSAGSAGGNGTQTSLGTLCVANGGLGGNGIVNGGGGNGGAGGDLVGAVGDVTITGSGAGVGMGALGITSGGGGNGGSSFFAGAANGGGLSGAGVSARGCGGGGGGGAFLGSGGVTGGSGADGCIIITEYIN